MTCSTCRELTPDPRFCNECGARLPRAAVEQGDLDDGAKASLLLKLDSVDSQLDIALCQSREALSTQGLVETPDLDLSPIDTANSQIGSIKNRVPAALVVRPMVQEFRKTGRLPSAKVTALPASAAVSRSCPRVRRPNAHRRQFLLVVREEAPGMSTFGNAFHTPTLPPGFLLREPILPGGDLA